MNILILGAAGFIGTNLSISLAKQKEHKLTLVDKKIEFFDNIKRFKFDNVTYKTCNFSIDEDYDDLVKDSDLVYHLVSTSTPSNSNRNVSEELGDNIIFSSRLFDSCVKDKVKKKVIFISSGGTVYGKEGECPLKETDPTLPISAYGLQKLTIEKMLYLYHYIYGLDYKVIRLSNPYGPYQRPNGKLGVVTTFISKAINDEEITIYGDGSIVRDFIYIDDVIKGIIRIAKSDSKYNTFNLGSGQGTSIRELISLVEKSLKKKVSIDWKPSRQVDVPKNYLDISRFRENLGEMEFISLEEGIKLTTEFLLKEGKNE